MNQEKKGARNRDGRLEAIKLLLLSKELGSQAELLSELRRMGFSPTQATLSRDLHQLKAGKGLNAAGRWVYVLPGAPAYRRVSDTVLTAAAARQEGVLSVKFSGNLAVLHTLPGHASHVAYDIDNKRFDEILGTLAGDDTVMMVLAEGVGPETVYGLLAQALPGVDWK